MSDDRIGYAPDYLRGEIMRLMQPFVGQGWTDEAKAEAKRVCAEYLAGLKARDDIEVVEIEATADELVEAGVVQVRIRLPAWMAGKLEGKL